MKQILSMYYGNNVPHILVSSNYVDLLKTPLPSGQTEPDRLTLPICYKRDILLWNQNYSRWSGLCNTGGNILKHFNASFNTEIIIFNTIKVPNKNTLEKWHLFYSQSWFE